MDDTADHFHQCTRDLLSLHNQTLREHASFLSRSGGLYITFTHTGYLSQKPQTPRKPLQNLLPIHCSSLAPGSVHYDRILRGTLIADPIVLNAAQTIIQDETGAAVLVSFYNFASDGLDPRQRQRVATSLFSRGTKIAIVEPFYKFATDGTLMIRVDQFHEDVVFLQQLGPKVSEGWRDEGKAIFQKQHFDEAIFSYKRSIDFHVQSKLAATLLSNIATALLVKEDLISSLLFSVASFVVDGCKFRPYYTAGFILNRLDRSDLAFNCLEQCRKLRAPTNLRRQLVCQLGNSPQVHVPSSKWNSDVLSIVASEKVHQQLQVKTDDVVNIMELKEKGNALFKKKKYDDSIYDYCMALRGIREVAILLTNQAIGYSRLGSHAEAALHASAAILITPSLSKAHYWKTMSLLQLNHKLEARACCKLALDIVGNNAHLKGLLERTGLSFEQQGTQVPRRPDVQKRFTERDQEELRARNSAPGPMVAGLNRMIELLNITGRDPTNMSGDPSLQLDYRVPPFHLEFSYEGKWPLACDVQSAMELLTRAYEHARAPDPLRLQELAQNTEPAIEDVCKRLNSVSPNVMQWWLRAPLRSLSPRVRHPYESKHFHSFTNSPCRGNVLMLGTVHASIGFTDLNELLFSRFIPSADHSGPLRWIGYEPSAYSVAKSMVLAQMLRQQYDSNEILQVWTYACRSLSCVLTSLYRFIFDNIQVWYSSSWTEKTLCSFRKALKDLVDSSKGADEMQYPGKVVHLWQHWQQRDVSTRTARSEWLSRHIYRNKVEIANFRRKMDRVALCRYLVSGEILGGSHGSVVMFGLPQTDLEGCEISLDEWFLHCLSIYSILDECDRETNVIDAAIKILQRRISELKERLQLGTVEIEVRYKPVTPNDEMTQIEIRKLSPHTISWSNLCDYYSNEAFNKMARACSGEESIHYLYSMNWSTEIKGAHLMDYDVEQHREMLDNFNVDIAALYRRNGVMKYLHAPPIASPYNVAMYSLGMGMHEVWTDNFFTAAKLDHREKQVLAVEPVMFNVLGRAQGTIYMVFTFNPAISWDPRPGAMP